MLFIDFYLDTDNECHHFALIYYNSTATLLSTYGGVPTITIIDWPNPINTLTKILQFDNQAYTDAFNINHEVEPYTAIALSVNIKPLYLPTFDDIHDILADIETISIYDFHQILAKDNEMLQKQF